METPKMTIIQKLNQSPATQIVNLPEVAERFKNLYVTFHGKNALKFYEAEKYHFAKIVQDNPKIAACTKLSLYGCFLDMAVNGLSFDPAMKHAYVVPVNQNVGTKTNPIWEARAQLRISGTGELVIREQQGQIKYVDNPMLVYDGDLFKMKTEDNKLKITHEAILPRKEGAEIIACFLRITRADDSIDYKVITMPEILKLKAFSKDPDSKAWTDGLPGMVQAKCIKHSFRNFPKVRMIGKYSQLASETVDIVDTEPIDIYGTDEPATGISEKSTSLTQPASQDGPIDDDGFTKTEEVKTDAGKTLDDDEF